MSIRRNALGRAKGAIGFGSLIGGAFVAGDAYSRVKNGQSVVTAIPTALAMNSIYAAMPGGYIGAGALMGVQLAPQIIDTLREGEKAHNQKKRMFNGYYQENDAQLSALSRGMDRMQQARGVRSSQMMNHAKGRVQAY